MRAEEQQAEDVECARIQTLLVSRNIHSWDACQMSNYRRLRCLLTRTGQGRSFKGFLREMKINSRAIWLLKVNEWKIMQSQWRPANAAEQINEFSSLAETFRRHFIVLLNMQTTHSNSDLHAQISPFQQSIAWINKHLALFYSRSACRIEYMIIVEEGASCQKSVLKSSLQNKALLHISTKWT